MRIVTCVCLLGVALLASTGCSPAGAQAEYQPHPDASNQWIQPVLGKDPDVYRTPNRNNNRCPGPNCPY